METCDGGELQERLRLYQVFLRLYEHNRGLLDEILSLENSGSKTLAGVSLPYIQGVTLGQSTHIITNLFQGKTQVLTQPQQTWIIGRDPHRAVLPIQDKRLSRCHAALKYVEGQGFYLIDLGSRNGTYINGELVRQSRLLCDGDRVRLGSLTFVFFHCQSVQHLRSLTAEMVTMLENLQPLASTPHSSTVQADEEDPTQGNRNTTMSSLEETSRFMRPHSMGSKFSI